MPSFASTLVLILAPFAMAGPVGRRQNSFFGTPSSGGSSGLFPGSTGTFPGSTGTFLGSTQSEVPSSTVGAGSGSNTGSNTGSSSSFSGSTQDGLSGACKDVTVIFARGTSEIGNVGTLTGPPLFKAIADQIGADKLAVQGVQYDASVGGIMQGGDTAGSKKMAEHVQNAFQKCPNTKVVMSGYSQGAMLVHNAAKQLPANISGKVSVVVNFGDPFKSQAVQGVEASRVKIICHSGDSVCLGTGFITADHLTYSQDAKAAADFVVGAIGK